MGLKRALLGDLVYQKTAKNKTPAADLASRRPALALHAGISEPQKAPIGGARSMSRADGAAAAKKPSGRFVCGGSTHTMSHSKVEDYKIAEKVR